MMLAMSMDAEERDRLVRLEVELDGLVEQVKSLQRSVDLLVEAANMGKGAWWIIIKIGGAITVLVMAFWAVLRFLKGI
jgi:hypothetical protein